MVQIWRQRHLNATIIKCVTMNPSCYNEQRTYELLPMNWNSRGKRENIYERSETYLQLRTHVTSEIKCELSISGDSLKNHVVIENMKHTVWYRIVLWGEYANALVSIKRGNWFIVLEHDQESKENPKYMLRICVYIGAIKLIPFCT